MRTFLFRGEYWDLPKSKAGAEKLAEIANRINSDPGIIETCKNINRDFCAKISEIVSDPDNAVYCGKMVMKLLDNTPCYSYIKNIRFGDRLYEVELDHIARVFRFYDIGKAEPDRPYTTTVYPDIRQF